jgi:hypothetical protein
MSSSFGLFAMAAGFHGRHAAGSCRPINDEVCALENAEVLRNRRPSHREIAGEFAHRQLVGRRGDDRELPGVSSRLRHDVAVSLAFVA